LNNKTHAIAINSSEFSELLRLSTLFEKTEGYKVERKNEIDRQLLVHSAHLKNEIHKVAIKIF
jgi:hypothetical protein